MAGFPLSLILETETGWCEHPQEYLRPPFDRLFEGPMSGPGGSY